MSPRATAAANPAFAHRGEAASRRGAASVQSSQQADSDYAQAQALELKARASLDAAQRQTEVIATQRQQTEARGSH